MQTEVDRKTFLGGSDAPGVLGMSRWKTPLQIWAEKTGTVESDFKESIPMMVGKALESTVIALFEKETGKTVSSTDDRFTHKHYPFMSAQIDARIKDEKAFLEVKTCTIRKAKEWEGDDEIPTEYIIQVMHDLAVTGDDYAYIAVLIGNEDFKWRRVERDEKMIAEMEKQESDFWNNFVVPKIMPETVTKNDDAILYKLFPKQKPGSAVDLGDDGARLVEMRNALYTDAATCEAQAEKLDNEIKLKMGLNEIAYCGAFKATWKEQSRKEHMVKASTFRAFRIAKMGGN